eukprot:scaffold23.g4169.t1
MEGCKRRLEVLQAHLVVAHDVLQSAEAGGAWARSPCRAAPPPARVVLVGAMVMDLQAVPTGAADVMSGGSVPGRVTQSPGGVARNVAESLAALLRSAAAGSTSSSGDPSSNSDSRALQQLLFDEQGLLLVSAVGDDLAGRALLQHWQSLGLTTAGIQQVPADATPTVAVVFNKAGEVAACVADVALLEAAFTPRLLLRSPLVAASLAGTPLLMLDGNLPAATIEAACRLRAWGAQDGRAADGAGSAGTAGASSSTSLASSGQVIWFEPVSVPKSVRATTVLSSLAYISPNAAELVAMADAAREVQQQNSRRNALQQQATSSSGPGPCSAGSGASAGGLPGPAAAAEVRRLLPHICTLLRAGVGHIALTLGANGAAMCWQHGGTVHVTLVPALPAAVVNLSGAGDCMVAGCLFALARGSCPERALCHGVAAAWAAVQSTANVPPRLSASELERGAAEAWAQAARLSFPAAGGL